MRESGARVSHLAHVYQGLNGFGTEAACLQFEIGEECQHVDDYRDHPRGHCGCWEWSRPTRSVVFLHLLLVLAIIAILIRSSREGVRSNGGRRQYDEAYYFAAKTLTNRSGRACLRRQRAPDRAGL